MEKHIPIIGGNSSIIVISIPQVECPFCKSLTEPSLLAAFNNTYGGRRHFLALFPCCGGHGFVSCSSNNRIVDLFSRWEVDPLPATTPRVFSATIHRISPSFETIYNEALIAQRQNLLNVCGGGYRKALEFLIFDYAIFKNPAESEAIRKMGQLANVVETYIDDKNLKTHLMAAAWLGNDTLHYEKKHNDLELNDLLSFIDDVVTEIELCERMEDKKKRLPDLEKKLK